MSGWDNDNKHSQILHLCKQKTNFNNDDWQRNQSQCGKFSCIEINPFHIQGLALELIQWMTQSFPMIAEVSAGLRFLRRETPHPGELCAGGWLMMKCPESSAGRWSGWSEVLNEKNIIAGIHYTEKMRVWISGEDINGSVSLINTR